MNRGKIKSFDHSTGSGVIARENGGEDVVVHFSAVKSRSQRTLQAGQFVQFELSRDTAGLRAKNVEVVANFATATPDISPQSVPVAAPSNQSQRKKTQLWPLGIGGVAAVGALFVALHSRHSTQPLQPTTAATTAATPSARAVGLASKPAPSKPLAKKPIVIPTQLAPLQGEKFAQTRLRELSPEEAGSLRPEQVQYALNEIYARHGYSFARSGPRQQFRRFAWYKPVKGQSQVASWQQFSAVEKRNAQLLNGARTAQREEQARQTQIARQQRRLDEQAQQERVMQRQVAQARQNEPEPKFTIPDSSDTTSDLSSETPDSGSSGDTTPTGFPIFTGPRGGRYHISKNGNKVYEKR